MVSVSVAAYAIPMFGYHQGDADRFFGLAALMLLIDYLWSAPETRFRPGSHPNDLAPAR